MIWKDATGYSRGAERIPTTWTWTVGDFRLTVTCGHIYYKGIWIVHCDPFFRERQLEEVETKEEAQAKATEMLRERLSVALAAMAPSVGGASRQGERS